ncbi:MAG: glycosyltransferase family 2 protein [Candidatus Gastranaerophilales bacterium]|nr:glycosyltransferase family 2 protein [Candidatus Gastranaerophilales bacterium]
MRDKKGVLALVVPCYNEEEVLRKTAERLTGELVRLSNLQKIHTDSFIVFVDDGSKDKTWEIIKELKKQNPSIKGIKLSRNFGHQSALLAGLNKVIDICDVAVTIDADLQQDEKALESFIDKYNEGYELVFGVRKDRNTDSLFKKVSASTFYTLMRLMGVNIIKNHADYRLASQKVLKTLAEYEETNLFLRGIFPSLGFKSTIVHHEVHKRTEGKTKYSLPKMLLFALNGITSFSVVPIRFISVLGVSFFVISIFMSLYALYAYIFYNVVHGWTSIVIPIYFIGEIQLLSLGVIGEYIGKIYGEVKRRPRYIIEEE